jgi:hypothetical protein
MKKATETVSNDRVALLYEELLKAREATIVQEIRKVCGLSTNGS